MKKLIFTITWIISISLSYALEPQYTLTRLPEANKLDSRLQSKLSVSKNTIKYTVWVSFTDKGIYSDLDYQARLKKLNSEISQKTLRRRQKVHSGNTLDSFLDIPVNDKYIHELEKRNSKIRAKSRWFNAVSIEATSKQIQEIVQLVFVAEISPVEKYIFPIENPLPVNSFRSSISLSPSTGSTLNYGFSSVQIYQINVNLLHEMGFHGEGVIIGILDTGFQHNTHEALTAIHVLQEYDFINNDTITQNQGGDPSGQDSHGTSVLSLIGGQKDGQIYGPAFKSDFLLAKTEILNQEIMVEEDYWVAGLEWEETNGADVVTSSLAYFNFDDGTTTFTYAQMDGTTRTTSKGAEVAFQQGVVVCNAMGNNGADLSFPYMNAPADGLHVVSVGAVDASGNKAGFSAIGPTYDGRTKPDVMALGVGNYIALANTSAGYASGSGTSYATPLTAGVAALLIQAHPTWSPQTVINALHSTASQALTPDNFKGWGIVNAYAAYLYQPTTNISDGIWQLYK